MNLRQWRSWRDQIKILCMGLKHVLLVVMQNLCKSALLKIKIAKHMR